MQQLGPVYVLSIAYQPGDKLVSCGLLDKATVKLVIKGIAKPVPHACDLVELLSEPRDLVLPGTWITLKKYKKLTGCYKSRLEDVVYLPFASEPALRVLFYEEDTDIVVCKMAGAPIGDYRAFSWHDDEWEKHVREVDPDVIVTYADTGRLVLPDRHFGARIRVNLIDFTGTWRIDSVSRFQFGEDFLGRQEGEDITAYNLKLLTFTERLYTGMLEHTKNHSVCQMVHQKRRLY